MLRTMLGAAPGAAPAAVPGAALDYQSLFELDPFGLDNEQKRELYSKWLAELGAHHRQLCAPYDRLVNSLGQNPALPVRLFKEYDLRSVQSDDVVKTMTSSGTTGQQVSRIFLDKATSARQTKALAKIVADFIGKQRLPMLIIDSSAVIKDRAMFSARGAGILGFSMLGRDICYALDEQMNLDLQAIETFASKYAGQQVLLFGFTFMVWQYFCQELASRKLSLKLNGSLIHGGGWKKLVDQQVGSSDFKQAVQAVCGIERVHDYYGMVEQTGSIFMECEFGHLHASVFSDIEIVDPLNVQNLASGRGLIKCTSLLPTSYPGHILLTEDEGQILGEDDCACGRKGKYFSVYGRMPGAEIRGCSDTHERR